MAKVAIMVDSEFGLTETQARDIGFYFLPININIDGVEMKSNVDLTMEYLFKNLKKSTKISTSAPSILAFQEEFRKALKENDHVIYFSLTKHFSSINGTAILTSQEEEFKGKVTVYDSEFICPWLLYYKDRFLNMMKGDATLEEYLEVVSLQGQHMKGWVFPENLERVYAGGRLSKSQYIAGTLFRITPVIPIIQGRINNGGIIKTKSINKAIASIVKNSIDYLEELKNKGIEGEILIVCISNPNENEYLNDIIKLFSGRGYNDLTVKWTSPAIACHLGVGGIGAGVVVEVDKEYKPINKKK